MNGRDGRDGRDGAPGRRGVAGDRGPRGEPGPRGRAAYEEAVALGFVGSESDWLESLRGKDGLDGKNGARGDKGDPGIDGAPGRDGRDAIDGKDGAQGPRGPRGPQGPKGDVGPPPLHQWEGTSLRFELPDGAWGPFVDLQGPAGKRARPADGGGSVVAPVIGTFSVNVDGLVPGPSSATGAFLRDDGTWQAVSGSGTVTSIDVTAPAAGITSSGGPVTTSGAITLALANDLAALEALSTTGYPKRTGSDAWSLLSGSLVTADLDDFVGDVGSPSGGVKGLVPAPASGDGVKFLKGDGTWSSPAGGGTVTSVDVTAPAAGITSSGGPVTGSGSITLALANDLAAVEGLSGTGWAKRTGVDAWALASVTAGDVSGLAAVATSGAAADVSGLSNVALTGDYSDLYGVPSLATIATTGSASDLASGTVPAARMPALTGDATSSSGAVATTVAKMTLDGTIANQSYSGTIIAATYGESLVPGDVVYFENDGSVHKADADGAAGSPLIAPYPASGLALETASSGSHKVLLFGIYRDDSRYSWNGGGVLYLSTTAGSATQVAPSSTDNVVQVLGVAIATHVVLFRPSFDYLTHT